MKKFFLFILTAAMSVAANAQVVTSRTMVKAKSQPTLWYGRIGLSLNNAAGGNDFLPKDESDNDDYKCSLGTRAGMSLDFGFQKPIKTSGLYWGMELGIGTRGATLTEKGVDRGYYQDDSDNYYTNKGNFLSWNIKYSPFQFGYKYSFTEDLKVDAHIGAYASYDFAGNGKWSWSNEDYDESSSLSEIKDDYDFQCFDAGMQLGIGVWWKNFNFDITWQKGFVTAVTLDNYETDRYDVNVTSSNIMLRIGYAF